MDSSGDPTSASGASDALPSSTGKTNPTREDEQTTPLCSSSKKRTSNSVPPSSPSSSPPSSSSSSLSPSSPPSSPPSPLPSSPPASSASASSSSSVSSAPHASSLRSSSARPTSVASALPHPSQLSVLRAEAVCKHLVKSRKAKLRDRKTARKSAKRFPNANKVWADLSFDLDDDGTRCDICGNYDSLPGHDEILLCDGCDVAVHQTCYYVETVPKADWYCQYCEDRNQAQANVTKLRRLAKSSGKTDKQVEATFRTELDRMASAKEPFCVLPKRCPLCPRSFGAHVRCGEDFRMWVHVNCAVWVPETWIVGVDYAGGLEDIPAWRCETICDICGVDEGAVIKCSVGNCPAAFHPICAIIAGYGMNLTGQIDYERKNDTTFHAFCLRHRGYTFRESVDAEEPVEYLFKHPDADHPFLRATNLVRRNRDIIFFAKQCHAENSTWGVRLGAYLIKELNENIVALRALWKRIEDLSAPRSLPCSASSSVPPESKAASVVLGNLGEEANAEGDAQMQDGSTK
uniref:PHD-finger domain-containing protein n=1 Tax=Neospora caninum (strain Liverpool) TaxID=572307 RepID=A0A0F7UF66_NEOCL|nr:TPA: PHD-finger domain-containing protein [Neospora caninum Liverpool]